MNLNLRTTGADDFENAICECCLDKWVCFHGVCCPLVRMAHTNAIAGVCGFWESAFCWFCCAFMTVGAGPCCLMVYWRMRLKAVMGITDHLLNDVCITLFCPLLSVCQQGTAVDTKMGYQVAGCCDLEWADGTDTLMVGQRYPGMSSPSRGISNSRGQLSPFSRQLWAAE